MATWPRVWGGPAAARVHHGGAADVLDVIVDPTVRDALRGQAPALRRAVARMVRAASLTEAREIGRAVDLEVALRFTDDRAIHELNRSYRRKDRPTDVLSFSQREGEHGALAGDSLGDIVISVETARRQARRGLGRELLFLAAHGLCHLLGYDHRSDEEERVMNRRAAALLRQARAAGRVEPA
jgi:probable rRNA maturation factor